MKRLIDLESRLKNLERIKTCLGTDSDLRGINKLIKQTTKKVKYYSNQFMRSENQTKAFIDKLNALKSKLAEEKIEKLDKVLNTEKIKELETLISNLKEETTN